MPAEKKVSARLVKAGNAAGRTDADMAAEIGVNRSSVSKVRRLLGLPDNRPRWEASGRLAALLARLAAGQSIRAAAAEMGVSYLAARRALSNNGCQGASSYQDNSARLSRAFDLFAAGARPIDVARTLGVGRSAASKYLKRFRRATGWRADAEKQAGGGRR